MTAVVLTDRRTGPEPVGGVVLRTLQAAAVLAALS